MLKKILYVILCAGILASCATGTSETPLPTPTVVAALPSTTFTIVPTSARVETATLTALPIPSHTATSLPPSATPLKPTTAPTTSVSIAPARPTQPIASTETLTRFFVNAAKHPRAKCNDGTTPLFFFRRGTGIGANKWVLYFQGGGFCSDEKACKMRAPKLTSSNSWRRSQLSEIGDNEDRADGIISNNPAHNPDFYNWNHVFMVYCSSDGWAGTRAASPESFGWHFAGHYIVDSMLDALQDKEIVGAPNLSNATQILVTGSSAGGFGVQNNIDRIAEKFSNVDVRAVSDSAVAPFTYFGSKGWFGSAAQAQWDLWQPRYDESCMAANASQPWICRVGDLLVSQNHITTPMFIQAFQLDPVLLDALGIDLRQSQNRAQVLEFATQLREILKAEPAVYSPFNAQHVAITNERFYEYKINTNSVNLPLFEVLGNWYFNRAGPKNVIEAPRQRR